MKLLASSVRINVHKAGVPMSSSKPSDGNFYDVNTVSHSHPNVY